MLLIYLFCFIVYVSASFPIYIYTYRKKWTYTRKMRNLLVTRLVSGVAILACLLVNRFILADVSVMEGSFIAFLFLILCLISLIVSDYIQLSCVRRGLAKESEMVDKAPEKREGDEFDAVC